MTYKFLGFTFPEMTEMQTRLVHLGRCPGCRSMIHRVKDEDEFSIYQCGSCYQIYVMAQECKWTQGVDEVETACGHGITADIEDYEFCPWCGREVEGNEDLQQ